MIKVILTFFQISIVYCFIYAQPEWDTVSKPIDTIYHENTKLKQQPGLALAASKIFFSEKRWSLSGFGEYNYVPLQQHVDTHVGDLELYYSGLYRQAVFLGYRLSDKLIWNSEFQVEFLHYRNQETHHEFVFEAFVDYLFRDYLKARVGFYPLTIGYVNNNDEPIMFYSVNRSEVERLITPSTWIELGAMLYGNLGRGWSYSLGFSQGLNSENYRSGSWIRQGREIRFNLPRSVAINPQVNYRGIDDLTLSVSGYYGKSGQGNEVAINNRITQINGTVRLTTAHAKYEWKNFRFITLGTYGQLSDTEKIYELTKDENGLNGQVLGKDTYGYLVETGCDIIPYLRKNRNVRSRRNFLYDSQEVRFSIFSRYEKLNTHHAINRGLLDLNRTENNMHIWTTGFNYNTKENIVFKANYQYRKNRSPLSVHPRQNIVETGMGFIF